MRKTLLMLLAIMLSISGWSVNYTVSISTSDSEAGYVAVDISGDGDVNDETYHDTDENGNYTEFEVAKNRQITLTPVLNDDVLYYFAGWSDGKTDYPRTIKVTKDWDLTAVFEAYPTYVITAVADPADAVEYVYPWSNNSISGGDNWTEVKEGETVTLSFDEITAGYQFVGWYDGDELISTNSDYSVQATASKTYTARFEEIPTYTVTVDANIPEGGEVYAYASGGKQIDDQTVVVEYWKDQEYLRQVQIEAYINNGYRFLGWYDGDELIAGPDDCYYSSSYAYYEYQFIASETKTYTARFEEVPKYTITVISDPNYPLWGHVGAWSTDEDLVLDNGAECVTGNGDCYGYWIEIAENTEISINAQAEEGYRFLGWYDGETQVYGPEYNNQDIYFTPTASKTYTAKFEEIRTYTISVSTNPTGIFDEEIDPGYPYVMDMKTLDDGTSMQVTEGNQYRIDAPVSGYDLFSYLKFHHWESDKGGYTTNNLEYFTATQDEHWTAVYQPDLSGYEQVGTTNLYCKDKGNGSIDIMGMSDNKYYQSTYATEGYYAAIQINGNSPVSLVNGYEKDGVKVTTSVLQSGDMARIVYRVTNTGTNDATVSLGTHADVQIGNNDEAPIETIRDDNDNVIGIVMRDGEGGQLYVIFGLGAAGSTLIDDYWFGMYYRNGSNDEIVGNYTYKDEVDIKEYGISYYMVENGSYDSGMGWCWKNRTIAAGQTVQYSYMIGIGEVKMEPSASVELTPVDMDSWNNVSATHTMYAEGIYTHTTGIDGYLEYQVETNDADKWVTLATDPQRLESDADFNGTFDVKFDASKSVHTIHFRTRDVMGNITPLPSKQFEDMRDYELEGTIVDKTYTGYAQTQDVLVSGIDAGKYTVSYTDNINAGTAKITLAGQYPHTIGYKQYTFTINPRPLVGDILFTTSYLVYDGNEHTPGWYLAGYNNLVENQDYTALWSNNILPGTATLKITGKGNYTGTLTRTFEIQKLDFEDNLYTLTLPEENILYDGNKHEATLELLKDGMGTAKVLHINRMTGEEAVPMEKGIYDIYINVSEGIIYHGSDGNLYAGTINIYEVDDTEWAALQAIHDDLITRGWANPWDISKGKAGISGFAGVTLTQGHVTALDLSDNNLTGTFPVSVLYLPYLESLDLSGNKLTGAVESGLDAYTAWLAGQEEDNNETIDVYVQKPAAWSSTYIWAWKGADANTENIFDIWPGVQMEETANGWWKYSGLPKDVSVVVNDYYMSGEQSMDIPDNGIGGGLHSDTWIVMTNEMVNNSSTGTYGYAANWWSDPVKGLRHINIADNELDGNIGAFASVFPHLATLHAQNNRIEDVTPMISAGVTSLNISNQRIATQRTIDLTEPRTMNDMLSLIPQVMLYNHTLRTYQLGGIIRIADQIAEPTWQASITVVNNNVTLASATGNEFRFTADDVLYAVENSTGVSFPVNVLFNQGDANFDSYTDVLDLQAIILFIKDEYTAQIPFNFTAANLFNDGVINVQDIVLMIERLLAEEEPQTAAMRRLPEEEDDEAAAELRWENGELHLISETAVAAMDLNIRADAAIEWLIPTHTVAARQTADGQHAVIYSLAGNTLAENKDIVIARSGDPAPVTVHAALADKEAKPVLVRLRTVGAKLPTDVENVQGDDTQSTKVIRNGVLYIERGGKMYDATGRLIEK